MRAMREARYRERSAGSAATGSTPATPAVRVAKPPAASSAVPAESREVLCGHRSMSGRTCTREQGHTAKSHRYASIGN
ncbi:MAG: hypothetical protein QOI51_1696 [Nocardioidaceae bacterium]|nr:hypothetical protein [Nocardioidaceae bacterium]